MVNNTNLPIRSVTRIACTSFALLFSVLLISAFTMVNCAVGEDLPSSKGFSRSGFQLYVSYDSTTNEPFKMRGYGNWSTSFILNGDNRSFTITDRNGDHSYNVPGSSTALDIHPQPFLQFTLTNSEINVGDLSLTVDDNDEATVPDGYSYEDDGCSLTFDKCYSNSLNIDIGYLGSDNAIVLAGNDLKTNILNLISGNVIFASDTTLNALTQGQGIALTSQSNSDVKITTSGTFTFNAPLTISSENNAALKICCESEGTISAESVFISSGRVDIQGTLLASLEIGDSAIFSPGNSPGTTEVKTGNFTLDSGATLLMEIASAGPDGNDILIVDGNIILTDNSEIELALANSNSLGLGQSFTAILTATNSDEIKDDILKHIKTSDFTELKYVSIDENTYAITGRRFTAGEIPEPSTWALLVLGAAGLLYTRKREKNA